MGYVYSIKYRTGKSNATPDALSRLLELSTLIGTSQPIHKYVEKMQKYCLQDTVVKVKLQELQ